MLGSLMSIHPEYVVAGVVAAVGIFLVLINRIPDVQGTIDLINVLNTKGGNILVLTLISVVFFFAGIHFLYYAVDRIIEGKLSASDAIVGMGFQWITGSAFGLTIGALLKTMSPESLTTATKPSTAVTEKVTTETTKETPPVEPSNG